MTLAEIRPILVVALIGLAALSAIRNTHRKGGRDLVHIPVRFEKEGMPQRIEIRRLDD